MSWLPTAAEERADALRRGSSGWRRSGPVLTVVFFILTLLGIAAFYLLVAMTGLPKGVTTAVVAIALAEWLIQRRRFFGTGIESALWIGGLFAIIFALPSSGKPEALLVFAAAAAIAGARMRSAFFGAAAAILVLSYIAVKSGVGWPPLAFGIATAALAALALRREWRRPSTERLIAATMIAMPLAAEIAWGAYERKSSALPFALLAAMLATLGIRARDRVTLAAAALAAGIAGFELRDLLALPLEATLIAAGALLIGVALAVARALRGRTHGFVIEPSAVTPYDEAMQILATIPAAHPAGAHAGDANRFEGGGGSGGGGGATDSF